MTAEDVEKVENTADVAHRNFKQIIYLKREVQRNFLDLAYLLKINRDNSLFKFLGSDTFDEFLGDPEISFRRSTAYNLIRIWELYIEKLDRQHEELVNIGNSKLLTIAPVVERDVEEWMGRAAALSKSDLKLEVMEAQGKESKIQKVPPKSHLLPGPPLSYLEWVKEQPCLVCEATPVDPHHFPITKGAGAADYMVVPLCRKCHSEYHANPSGWTWENRRKWGDYFYRTIGWLWSRCDEEES